MMPNLNSFGIRVFFFFAVDLGCCKRALALSEEIHERDQFPWEIIDGTLAGVWPLTVKIVLIMLIKVTHQKIRN